MSPFEHLSVLISIVIGLGLAHLLMVVQKLIQYRESIRFHWLPLAWAVLLFTTQVEWWWASFSLGGETEWNFFYFLFLLLSPVALFLASALVLPEIEAGSSYDLHTYYFATHRWFFGILALNPALDAVRRGLEVQVWDISIWSNVLAATMALTLAGVKNVYYHALITLLIAGLFLFFIVSAAIDLG